MNFYGTFRMISSEQFGFLSGQSTELQLLVCIDDWTKALDHGIGTDVIYILTLLRLST